MADGILVAIHEVEIGPQGKRQIVKAGKPFPAGIDIDPDLEAELVRIRAAKRVFVGGRVSTQDAPVIARTGYDIPSTLIASMSMPEPEVDTSPAQLRRASVRKRR